MVETMAASWRERAAGFLDAVKNSPATSSKMEQLRQLKRLLMRREPLLLHDFVPQLTELQTGQPSPVRKFIAEAINDIGQKNMELLPEMIPTLVHLLKDVTPAVVRQAITSGTSLFQFVLQKLVLHGLQSNNIDKSLYLSWTSMLKFKDSVFPLAFQTGNDGIRLLAIKLIEVMVLLYTPDPSVPSDPPKEIGNDFSISWVHGSNPVLNVSELATESSQCLGMLLDQLRLPRVKCLSNSITIVLVNCVSSIARKRPSFYGRVLPVLLALDPEKTFIKGVHGFGAYHGLKNAFLTCLQCTHPAALPWRPRLANALKALTAGNSTVKEENLFSGGNNEVQLDLTRKRTIKEEPQDLMEDDVASGKRARISPPISQDVIKESALPGQDHVSDAAQSNIRAITGIEENGPIQQLVSTFGALVAQGDKAVQLLDILISSISSDLLAEVVMANMQHLPLSCPKIETEDGNVINDSQTFIRPSFFSGIFSSSFPSSLAPLTCDIPNAIAKDKVKKEPPVHTSTPTLVTRDSSVLAKDEVETEVLFHTSSFSTLVEDDTERRSYSSHSIDESQSSIPGLENEQSELRETSQTSTSSLENRALFDKSSGLIPAFVPEPSSSNATLIDTGFSASTSSKDGFLSQYTLPKMAAPVIPLTDEQKDLLQKLAYTRIIDAYKQVAVAGGIQLRFSLLSCLGVEFPLELDAWGPLQKHVLEDYLNQDGHELTLSVLYRLYRETEQDKDFFSSTAAISAYETFLLTVVEALRDSFPPSDKSLSRLLVEVPYIPKPVIKLLESMCSPESTEKDGDHVTQGLSTVWSLILRRPSNRDIFLKIALQSTVHQVEEVRMKAIRLVANKLFPMSSIAEKIEEFASEMLLSLVDQRAISEGLDSEGSPKDADSGSQSDGQPSASVVRNDTSNMEPSEIQNLTYSSVSEAQRCLSLYFALCTKKHSLLQQLFAIYKQMPKPSKQAVHGHIPILVRTIGCSPDLLRIISQLPDGCENLLIQVLNTLTDATVPPPELLSSVKKLYESKVKDVEILIPIISSLPKDEILSLFPRLINLPLVKFQLALARILQGSPQSGPPLTPPEVLIAIHEIDPERDVIPLKKVMDACSACFELRQVFTQQVFAKALNQLVEQIPLPLLFMRTVIQVVGVFPALNDFIMEILSRLVNKQIWKYPKLWVGFLKCALQTKPQSFGVLLQLPAAQLENALTRNPALKPPLVDHASQPNIRSTLPRTTLAVLGLVSDPLPPPPLPRQPPSTPQSQPPERDDSNAEGASEMVPAQEPTPST